MRRLAAALLLLAAASGAPSAQSPAPPPPSAPMYAVVSMVGDRLLVLNRSMRTGSNLRRDERAWVELHDVALNDALGDDVYDALEPRLPGARVVLMTVRDPSLWKAQNRLLEEGGTTQELVSALGPFLDHLPAATTYIVLASKMRSDAFFDVDRSRVGGGKAEGLGFYVDRNIPYARDGYVSPIHGFLAAFAYFRLSLIDARTRAVLREVPVAGSVAHTADDAGGDHPWDTMTGAQKVDSLKKVMHDEAARAVEKLLAG